MIKLPMVLLTLPVALCGLARAESGSALIKGTAVNSGVGGVVSFRDEKGGLRVTAKLSGLPPGSHGFHIHEFGSCDDAGKAAGSHYNPRSTKHGHVVKDGSKKAHAGDMGNLAAGADGTAVIEVLLPNLRLCGRADGVAGRAIVVHEKEDDFGQPVGNAGGRIGCGTIVVTGL